MAVRGADLPARVNRDLTGTVVGSPSIKAESRNSIGNTSTG
jgi:hypothetical protein